MTKLMLFLSIFSWQLAFAQYSTIENKNDSVSKPIDTIQHSKRFYQTKSFKIIASPSILIGYGISTIGKHGLFLSSNDVYDWRQAKYPNFKTKIDNYLPSAPLGVVCALDLFGVESKHNFVNQSFIFLMANGLNGFVTHSIKDYTHIQRPDKIDFQSFPSAHTSSAFVAAEILHQEFKDKSIWISIVGYTLASSVGTLRILNNRHWLSDVCAGAGVGILSVKLTYFVFPWIQKKICGQKNKLRFKK